MKYMGSKNRIAKHLIPIMIAEADKHGITTWVEPFVGGANLIDKVPTRFKRIGYDINASNTGKRDTLSGMKATDLGKISELRVPRSIQKFNTEVGLHPTQKPVALLEYLIKTYTQEGETVLDFTAGSMSTAIACINTNRKGIMIERDEHYFKVGSERVKKTLSEKGD